MPRATAFLASLVAAVTLVLGLGVATTGLFVYDGDRLSVVRDANASTDAGPDQGFPDAGEREREARHRYDTPSQPARAIARPDGYRLAPKTAGLADDALVVRGGQNLPENIASGRGVTIDTAGRAHGVSVQAGTEPLETLVRGHIPAWSDRCDDGGRDPARWWDDRSRSVAG